MCYVERIPPVGQRAHLKVAQGHLCSKSSSTMYQLCTLRIARSLLWATVSSSEEQESLESPVVSVYPHSPWVSRRCNHSILKEISPEYSLEGLILKLRLQYFGNLM